MSEPPASSDLPPQSKLDSSCASHGADLSSRAPEADGPQRPEMVVFILFWLFYGFGLGLLAGWLVWA